MASRALSLSPRRATNVSLSAKAVEEAKALGINVSQACENGLLIELKKERERRWQLENAGAIEQWNAWVHENGLPIEPMF